MAGAATNPRGGGIFDPSQDVAFTGGVTLTAPLMPFTAYDITATGATGTTAYQLTSTVPAVVNATGTSGAGINLVTGAAVPGAFLVIRNAMTGVLNVYSVGATINGTTGTTAATITATGNRTALAYCAAAGAWLLVMNT